MTVAIIDDEKIARDTIRKLLELTPVPTQVVGEAANVQEGIVLVNQSKIDILFLDINLGPQSGFDLLQQVSHTDFHLVFTTAYDQFALKAFRFHAMDYLLKPITPNKLYEVLRRVESMDQSSFSSTLEALMRSIRSKELDRIRVSTAEGIFYLNLKDVVRLEGFRSYTTFFMKNGEKITVAKTIKEYETLFPKETFFRIHKAHLINVSFITTILKKDGASTILVQGEELPISRNRRKILLDFLDGYSINS